MSNSKWQLFDLAEVRDKLKGEAVEYLEFLNVPALNCGVYFLAAGSTDMQAPHDEDEVYLVLSGRARMLCDPLHERAGLVLRETHHEVHPRC